MQAMAGRAAGLCSSRHAPTLWPVLTRTLHRMRTDVACAKPCWLARCPRSLMPPRDALAPTATDVAVQALCWPNPAGQRPDGIAACASRTQSAGRRQLRKCRARRMRPRSAPACRPASTLAASAARAGHLPRSAPRAAPARLPALLCRAPRPERDPPHGELPARLLPRLCARARSGLAPAVGRAWARQRRSGPPRAADLPRPPLF